MCVCVYSSTYINARIHTLLMIIENVKVCVYLSDARAFAAPRGTQKALPGLIPNSE